MLNLDVTGIELFVMEDQIHLTITGTICAVILGVTYWFFSSREALIAEEIGPSHRHQGDMDPTANMFKMEDWTTPRTGVVCLVVAYVAYMVRLLNHLYFDQIEALLRKVTGLKSGEEKSPRQPIQLGPSTYKPLIFSVLSCTVWLAFIWLIKITPFEKLYKSSPLYKLVKILFNSPDLEREEDDRMIRGSPEHTARHQKILNTCMDLERRMSQLERCLTPLARSLQTLTEVIESRSEPKPVDQEESQVLDHQEPRSVDHQHSQVMDLLAQIKDDVDFEVTDSHDGSLLKSNSDSQVTCRLDSNEVEARLDSQILDRRFQDPDPADSQVPDNPDAFAEDRIEFQVKTRRRVIDSSDQLGQKS